MYIIIHSIICKVIFKYIGFFDFCDSSLRQEAHDGSHYRHGELGPQRGCRASARSQGATTRTGRLQVSAPSVVSLPSSSSVRPSIQPVSPCSRSGGSKVENAAPVSVPGEVPVAICASVSSCLNINGLSEMTSKSNPRVA